ncbi:MAG: glutamate--tRNA ligase, partial [Thermodesulfobacteriota bacterium]
QKLILDDRVYPCYCTEAELEAERTDLVVRRMMPRYMGKCRCLTESERRRLGAEGRVPVWRFRVEEGSIRFDDLIRASMSFQGEAIGDFVIVRSSGMPSYNFAVVVDDHFMEISHVIRGEDHLSNTATQILLFRALGWEPPLFAHHALITGDDHAKLSKRHGAVSVREFRRRGILPEVLLNYLALLGGSFSGVQEIRTAHELCRLFSLNRTGRGGAVFNEEKLLWLNRAYIRRYETENLADKLIPFVRAAGYDALLRERNRLEGIVAAVQDNLMTLADIGGFLDLFADERYRIGEDAAAIIRGAEARKALQILHDELFLLTRNYRGDSGTAPSEGAMNQTIFRNLIQAV